MSAAPLRVATIGIEHPHVFDMAHTVVEAGAEMVAWYPGGLEGAAEAPASPLAEIFGKAYPAARRVADVREILEDERIALVLCAAVSAERADIAIAAMRHGKDVLSDKPGVTSFEQLAALRTAQAETARRYTVFFSERLRNKATVRASELVQAGAIGRVLQTIGLGPHRLNAASRPAWFFQRARYGGILCDIASHQMEQFLHFTGAERASVATARVANLAHPEHPELEDFGEALVEADGCSGYVRVDWFTPDGLASWGDGRLFLLGTEGTLEVRKNIDLAGRAEGSHLFLVDGAETRYIDCSDVALPFGRQLLADVAARSETALPQEHCFRACHLALEAQAFAASGAEEEEEEE